MPGRNGMGPRGEGPLTGRRLGNCSGEVLRDGGNPGFYGFRRGLGRGFGPGAGRRFGGWGRGFYASETPVAYGGSYEDDERTLEAQEKYLEAELHRVRSLRERKPGDES